MFTRQHYNAIAAVLKDCRRTMVGDEDTIDKIADKFIDLFIEDNDNFKPQRFSKAMEQGQ